MMLSPTPFSLLCALLLCLPLAIVFTITHPSSSASASADADAGIPSINKTSSATGINRPFSSLVLSPDKTFQKPKLQNATVSSKPAPAVLSAPPQPLPAFNETDEAEDDTLFQLAGRANPNPKPPLRKLAFMFLTTTPLPFAPLWELFFDEAPRNLYNVYVHADPSFTYAPPFAVFTNRVIPSKPTRRHSSTLIAATRRLTLLHDKSNYMFALLSPSCIPIRSFNFTHRFLTRSRRSFVEILDSKPWARERWAARGEDAMLPELRLEDFRIGSQFFVLKRKHARTVARDRRLWSKFKLPCLDLDACYPEEHYFATLLSMVDPHGCVPATLTSVDWRGSYGGHPRMYSADEVGPQLIRSLRKRKPRYGKNEGSPSVNGSNYSSAARRRDPFLFARKFSAGCVQPLISIAKDFLFRD